MTQVTEKTTAAGDGSSIPPAEARSIVKVRVSQEGRKSRGFEPLTPPRDVRVAWKQSNFDHFERIHTTLRVELEPGKHSLPILHDEVLYVDVTSGTSSTLRACVGHMDGGKAPEAVITDLDWQFDSPVVLYNIVPILARLHTLFKDRELTEWLTKLVLAGQTPLASKGLRMLEQFATQAGGGLFARFIPTPSQMGGWLDKALETLRNSSDQTAVVRLHQIRGTPAFRDGTWQLDFRFTGEVVYLGTVTVPFRDLRVPRLVIPSAHAALRHLISGEPLATASIRTDRVPARTLLIALARLVSGFEGDFNFAGETPDLDLEVVVAGGGQATTYLKTEGLTEGKGKLSSRTSGELVTLSLEGVELKTGECKAVLDGHVNLRLSDEENPEQGASGRSVVAVLLNDLFEGGWASEHFSLESGFTIRPGASLPGMGVHFQYEHPMLKGRMVLNGRVEDLSLEGSGRFLAGPPGAPQEEVWKVPFRCHVVAEPGSELTKGGSTLGSSQADIQVEGSIEATAPGCYRVELDGGALVHVHSSAPVEAFPEFSIDDSQLLAAAEGRGKFSIRATSTRRGRHPALIDFRGSAVQVTMERARVELDGRVLLVPEAADVAFDVVEGELATTGLGHSQVKVVWDFHRHSPLLHGGGRIIDLLVPELRQGEVYVHVSPSGGLSVTGPEWGLFDARFFNALLHPSKEARHWLELVQSEEVVEKATAVLEVFSPELSLWLERIRSFASRARRVLKEEEVSQPKDLIPAANLARFAAKLLADQPGLEVRLMPIVMGVVEGKGLDVPGIKRLLYDLYPDHGMEYEVDRLLRWLDHLLRPGDPPPAPEVCKLPPLSEDPTYVRTLETLPSAARLYRTVDSAAPLPAGFSATLARIAAYLTQEQLEYLVAKGRKDWEAEDLQRIRYVLEVKRRVRMIRGDYGGVTFAPQAMAISFFLADAVSQSRASDAGSERRENEPAELVPNTLLGPDDVAVVLQAGLASAWAGRAVQVNQRRLLDFVFSLPPQFLHSVLVELGGNDHRVLTGALNVLLNQPQGLMRQPLDMVGELSARLGLTFPRIQEYLAGGKWAKLSYYEAISTVAEQILSHAEPYRAMKYYLQEVRHPVVTGRPTTKVVATREAQAQKAVAHADTLGHRCTFRTPEPAKRKAATEAYHQAFAACAAFLETDATAFQLPWFKEFWSRNHEALVVRGVVRNVQQDVDRVRDWLTVRTSRPVAQEEQALLAQVVEALYYFEKDRSELLADPLVRLLIDPPEGELDFTIVSCMGVVTEGAQGTELEDAYARLYQRHKIRVIRADTATARSLDHNADRIIEAISQVRTPYGLIGYSQGCANALLAESRLLSGTPAQQALLAGLVSRNLLFSAANGSSHGTCGDVKFARAMVELDRFLAHYQAVLSRKAIDGFLRTFRTFLDSRSVVDGILGSRSVARWGVIPLQRGGQFKSTCPTSVVRGIVEPGNTPEALEFLANSLTHQNESPLHDTQVSVDDAVGHFTLVQNPHADILARCDMGCRVQRTHHWSPLLKETAFLTTPRDRQQAIYDSPKDRHVFPWIEVNARFGLIRPPKGVSA